MEEHLTRPIQLGDVYKVIDADAFGYATAIKDGHLVTVTQLTPFGEGYDVASCMVVIPEDIKNGVVERVLTLSSLPSALISSDDIMLVNTDEHMNHEGTQEEYTGFSVSYYKIPVEKPFAGGEPYIAEVIDIIEALDMNFSDGNQLKSLIRRCVAEKYGLKKSGYKDGIYDAEKSLFFAERTLNRLMEEREKENK